MLIGAVQRGGLLQCDQDASGCSPRLTGSCGSGGRAHSCLSRWCRALPHCPPRSRRTADSVWTREFGVCAATQSNADHPASTREVRPARERAADRFGARRCFGSQTEPARPGGWLDWRPGLQVTHCTLSLCSLAMLLHYALSLCALTMLSHCALSLCSLTVLSHYALPLCALTVLSHCALARPGAILGLSWHNSGCAGGWLVTDSKFSACLVLVSGCPTMAQYGPRGALYSDKI